MTETTEYADTLQYGESVTLFNKSSPYGWTLKISAANVGDNEKNRLLELNKWLQEQTEVFIEEKKLQLAAKKAKETAKKPAYIADKL